MIKNIAIKHAGAFSSAEDKYKLYTKFIEIGEYNIICVNKKPRYKNGKKYYSVYYDSVEGLLTNRGKRWLQRCRSSYGGLVKVENLVYLDIPYGHTTHTPRGAMGRNFINSLDSSPAYKVLSEEKFRAVVNPDHRLNEEVVE